MSGICDNSNIPTEYIRIDAAEAETLAAVERALEACVEIAGGIGVGNYYPDCQKAIRALDPDQFVKGQDT